MTITLDRLEKRFGGLPVVDSFSLEVRKGELFVLLGASGSGKSTILRLIAGLLYPESGRILLDDVDITFLAPQQRNTGFVFQNYSIFRHMTVAENIEFGLRIRKVDGAVRKRKCTDLLDLVGLGGLGERYADQLSGGQQQRVALPTALAYEPAVLLLDEPFGALDVKIRSQLRRSLREIVSRLGVTTILVTHDQEEAFELADRIGVIDRGRLLEVDDPEALYKCPRTTFVSTFLGAGTLLVGHTERENARFGHFCLPLPSGTVCDDDTAIRVLFRAEQVVLSSTPPPPDRPVLGTGRIIEHAFAGSNRRVRLRLPHLERVRQIAPALPFGEDGLLVDALLPVESPLLSEELWVSLRDWHILTPPAPAVLVCDPGQGRTAALAMGRVLSRQLKASLSVLRVANSPEESERIFEALRGRLAEEQLEQVDLRVRFGKVAEQILAEQIGAMYRFLIVNYSNRPSGASHRLSGSLNRLLEQACTPVLVVKQERDRVEKILLCTAAGEPGKIDVRMGGWLARRLRARVTLLYVTSAKKGVDSLARAHLERATGTLRALDIQSRIETCSAARPAEGILNAARQDDYDMIIVGSHGPRSRSMLGLDDVTLQVLHGTDLPVLVVPGEEDV